jgi:glycosyltransferase involved in cell wall biosynthesis
VTTVVHLINSLRRGGSEGQAVQLARLLQETGSFEVTLACLDGGGPLRDEIGDGPPALLEYPLTSLHDRNTARQLRRFAADLRERDVSIVHTHDVYSNIFGLPAARLAGVPARVASRRDTGGVGTNSRRRVEGMLYRLAHKVVTNADAVARDLAGQGVPESKIVTIHNAVDVARMKATLSRRSAHELFQLPEGRRFVVLVANLSHDVKDHPTFVRAAKRIKDAVPESAFVVAGTGPLASRLRSLAESLGIRDDLFLIGACSAIGDLLSLAEVCVLSSTAEGLSNAVLEYMAAGRPVVATDVGGIREAVVEGETGYLVAARDDGALADRVISLLQDPERARGMGELGRRRVVEEFSCELLVERVVDLYEDLLAGTGR